MPLIKVPIYSTRNLAAEVDSGARTILPGTNISFTTNADGSITINNTGGAGTVTSVGASGSTGLTIGGTNPVTTSGTITFTLSANLQGWSGISPITGVGGPYVMKAGDTMTGTLNGTSISLSGNLVASGSITSAQNFLTGGTNVVLANNGTAGGIFLRPNGAGSATGQLVINSAGLVTISGGATITGNTVVNNADLYSYRTGGTTGVIFLNSTGTRYLYYDGTKYILNAAKLEVGGDIDSGATITANTLGTTPAKIGVWTASAAYGMFGWSGMTGNEYAVLVGSADTNTYVSSRTGGAVKIRPSANSTAHETTFDTTGMTLSLGGAGRRLSKITVSSAAPGALADGELYLRY